jgi:putative CocE/NonD family hydrolase
MSLASAVVARRMRLPRAQTHDVLCERDLRITMDDGVVLLADRYVARTSHGRPQPTVLVRSPYGRRQVWGLIFGRLLAERGLQVVLQSVRGTFGSQGTFNPFDERADGLATLRWIRTQPWHAQRIGMLGPSYLGLVQWALTPDAGDDLAALAIQVSASQFHGQTYPGGSLALETAASWLALVSAQERRLAPLAMARAVRRLPSLLAQLPGSDLDARLTGAEVPWFREGLANPSREDAYWVARDYAGAVGQVTAPVQLVGGWYDIFLPWMLEDFGALQAAGRSPQLTIGPWAHVSPGLAATGLREGLGWLRAHLLDDDRLVRPSRVRVYVSGEGAGRGWRELPGWPPPDTSARALWLAGSWRLQEIKPAGNPDGADRYHYDPADPTPSLGGPVLLAREPVADNRPLEARADVLTYTTPRLARSVEAIGPVSVELWVRSSAPHFDIFARVCDVDAHGASWNVCDALARVAPGRFERAEDAATRVAFDLWPMAHRFAAGRQIRLQVSSGAYPRYARNPGSGEDSYGAAAMRPFDVEVLHDPEHPSRLLLPAPQPGA